MGYIDTFLGDYSGLYLVSKILSSLEYSTTFVHSFSQIPPQVIILLRIICCQQGRFWNSQPHAENLAQLLVSSLTIHLQDLSSPALQKTALLKYILVIPTFSFCVHVFL